MKRRISQQQDPRRSVDHTHIHTWNHQHKQNSVHHIRIFTDHFFGRRRRILATTKTRTDSTRTSRSELWSSRVRPENRKSDANAAMIQDSVEEGPQPKGGGQSQIWKNPPPIGAIFQSRRPLAHIFFCSGGDFDWSTTVGGAHLYERCVRTCG